MTSTPYQTSDTIYSQTGLTAVATTGSVTTTPYGFTTAAQADALVAQVNLIIQLLQKGGFVAIG